MSEGKRLIFKCVLATQDKSVKNKPATNPPRQPATSNANNGEALSNKPAIPKSGKPATPPVSGNKSTKVDLSIYRSSFDEFWSVYPRKTKKALAFNSWVANSLHAKKQEIIEDVLERNKKDINWMQRNQYVPYPVTYLNQERWLDEEKAPMPAQTLRGGDYADAKYIHQQERDRLAQQSQQESIEILRRKREREERERAARH